MKFIKTVGLLSLICFTFFYTEKVMDMATLQDDIMIKLNDVKEQYYKEPVNASINDKYIIPGRVGSEIDINGSYFSMKKLGYFDENLLIYQNVYPEISIYNNYNKYVVSGNVYEKNIALIFIINNRNVLDNVLDTIKSKKINISFFVDSKFLNSNMEILNLIKGYEVYNYGNNGVYTMDNLIIFNNIIKNKTKVDNKFCLFLKEEDKSLNNCASSKIFSIMPSVSGGYNEIKNNLSNGSIILVNNSKELGNIIQFVNSKGYNICKLVDIINE